MSKDVIVSVKNLCKNYRLRNKKMYNNESKKLWELLNLSSKENYREHKVLDDIKFEMNRGESLALIGRNGCGKSTLLKVIAGLLQPTSGEIEVYGKVFALVQLGATFNPEFTGMDNVKLYASALGYTPKEIKEKLLEIIRFAEINEFIYQKLKTYSSGMKSRLAFSVVINLEPEILIIDEVLSVGDIFFKQKCIEKLKQMLENGMSLLFVSHSLGDIKALCKKAAYLDQGRIVAYGAVEEVMGLYESR